MEADGEYNRWDQIQLAARAVVRRQQIDVEIDTKISLLRKTIKKKFIWRESAKTIYCKTKRRVKDKDIKNEYDLMKAIRKEVADREWNSWKEEIEALYKDMSYILEWDKVKLMRDIREEGSCRENRFQDIRAIYKEISVISRSRLDIKHFKKIVQAVKEGYFGNKYGRVKQASQAYSNEYTIHEHSMGPNRHEGKRKRRMSFGIVSDLLLSRNWIKIDTYNGTDTRSSHRKLIEKYKSIKDRNKVSRKIESKSH